jgi:DNA polymerase II large subunit
MEETSLEQHKHNVCMVNMNGFEEISRFSSLKRLEGVMAYCLHFIDNARNPKNKKWGSLTVDETEEAVLRCIRKTQELSYPDELRDL